MYELAFSQSARKSYKRLTKGAARIKKDAVALFGMLRESAKLPARYKDHGLQGGLSAHRECHLRFNVLVIYKRNDALKLVTIADIGTHDELFK